MTLIQNLCAGLLAAASSLATAHPHDVPAPPAPPAPPVAPAPPAPPAHRAHGATFAPPALPAIPAMPALPPAPPAPPPPIIDIPDDILAACEGKADRSRVETTASNGARISGICRKRGNVYAFMLESYEMGGFKRRQRN